jgi:AcrR family transcriptional regulator
VSDVGLRERRRERTHEELRLAALGLFAEHGIEATTIEMIAEAVDISPRTFFRYFASKEDALFGDSATSSRRRHELMAAALQQQAGSASPGAMLRAALSDIAATYEPQRAQLLMRKQVISATPSLQGRAVQRRQSWEAAAVEGLAARFGDDEATRVSLRVTVAAATAGLQVAIDEWLESDGRRTLTSVFAEVWQHLVDGVERRPPGTPARRPKRNDTTSGAQR